MEGGANIVVYVWLFAIRWITNFPIQSKIKNPPNYGGGNGAWTRHSQMYIHILYIMGHGSPHSLGIGCFGVSFGLAAVPEASSVQRV